MESYEFLKFLGAVLAIFGGVFGLWKFLIQPVWRTINSILDTLRSIQKAITNFSTSIGVIEAIIPRIEKDIDGIGGRLNRHDKRLIDLERNNSC